MSDSDMEVVEENPAETRGKGKGKGKKSANAGQPGSKIVGEDGEIYEFPTKFARTPLPSLPPIISMNNRFDLFNQDQTDGPGPSASTNNQDDNADDAHDTKTPTRPTPGPKPRIGAYHLDLNKIIDCKTLVKDLNEWTKNSVDARCNRTQLVIQPKTMTAHHKVGQRLELIKQDINLRKLYFFDQPTYFYHRAIATPREKFVIKGLPPKLNTQDLLTDIRDTYGIPIYHLSEMQKMEQDKTIRHLGLYVCETNKDLIPTIKETIQYVSYYSVKIVSYINNNRIPRCNRCQQFGHTKNHCSRKWVCGKCAESHDTAFCTSSHIKCVNCSETHEASWPGCAAFQLANNSRLQAIARLKERQTTRNNQPPPDFSQESFPVLDGRTFADTTANRNNSQDSPTTSNNSTSNTLKDIIDFIKNNNITRIIQIIKDIINIFKGPDDILTKLLTAATKLCELC